jgi:hypothetical protein
MPSVADQQMPLSTAPDARQKLSRRTQVERVCRVGARFGVTRQDVGMSLGRPERPRLRACQMRRLEGVKSPKLRLRQRGISELAGRGKRLFRRPQISGIAPQPLPGEQRWIHAQQMLIILALPPVGLM